MTGYLHPDYARSLFEFGEPAGLPGSGGWLLKRSISGTAVDAMGPYPLFACSDWTKLECDLDQIGTALVSSTVIADPFGNHSESLLRVCFPDLMIPFKAHFVTDLQKPLEKSICEHHARNARLGLKQVKVERCEQPSAHLEDWVKLYSVLMQRHEIRGIRAFSKGSFAIQLQIPGIVSFRAVRDGETVGMILWYVQNGIAYYHLGAYTDEAYQLRASFALFREALDYFATRGLAYANLGAGAGIDAAANDGLSRFKRGWSTATRTAYLCGRIFDRKTYCDLTQTAGVEAQDYFPAYRKGEFN